MAENTTNDTLTDTSATGPVGSGSSAASAPNPWSNLGEPDFSPADSSATPHGGRDSESDNASLTEIRDAGVPASTRANRKRQGGGEVSTFRWIVETAFLLLLALVIAQGIKVYLVQPYIVPTGSMIPTIEINDRLLANKLSIWLGEEPKAGDIVVLDDPTGQFDALAKRVVAVGGQTVDLIDGSLYIDGQRQAEAYTHGLPTTQQIQPMPYKIPAGEVWVMGDNRTNSADSRTFGSVPVSSIRGLAFWTYWPLDRFGALR